MNESQEDNDINAHIIFKIRKGNTNKDPPILDILSKVNQIGKPIKTNKISAEIPINVEAVKKRLTLINDNQKEAVGNKLVELNKKFGIEEEN